MTSILHISCTELCDLNGVTEEVIFEAVEYGVINPVSGNKVSEWVFTAQEAACLKRAMRLQQDLELDWVSLALVLDLLQEKESLQKENERLQQRLDRFLLNEK
jgi:chaperone modulatory protein CbpM